MNPSVFRNLTVAASSLAASILLSTNVVAQGYPTQSVTLVVPAGPGGPSDVVARVLAEKLRDSLGQAVVVENRGGAHGTIGVGSVARSKPDGHTVLLAVDGPITTIPALMSKLPYDPIKDLQPVAIAGDGGDVVLAVQTDSPARTVQDLVSMLRKDPAGANYVSSGAGFPSHVVGEIFKREAGFDAQHIPVRGAGAAMTELLSGRMSFSFPPASLAAVHAQGGKIRLLAVASAKRNLLLPDVPTFAEAGYSNVAPPGYWIATYVPSGTPEAIVNQLSSEIRRAAASDEFSKLLKRQGLVASNLSPQQIADRVRSESDYWAQAVRDLNIRIE